MDNEALLSKAKASQDKDALKRALNLEKFLKKKRRGD